MKGILFCLIGLLGSTYMSYGQYSYFYIEGDQETPFYVKVEGRMQERLGKDYFIIPNLDAGYTNFEILFQQNKYPAQKFILEVPQSGSRGFVLNKVNDRQFALYDLQQKRYIVAGNKEEDDFAPTMPLARAELNNQIEEGIPDFSPKKENTSPQSSKNQINYEEHRFIDGIELNTGVPVVPAKNTNQGKRNERKKYTKEDLEQLPHFVNINEESSNKEEKKVTEDEIDEQLINRDLPPIANSDCPSSMSNTEFEELAIKILDQSNDDRKLRTLKRNKEKLCFSTEQVRVIANNLTTQSARFEVVSILYPQTSDQENYPVLESLFNTTFLKNKFQELLNP